MTRVIHVSDLHYQIDWRAKSLLSSGWRGAPGRFELHGLGRFARFDGVHERIARLVDTVASHRPDHVVLTGDLSALGDPRELAAVRELFTGFISEERLTVVPGNHDRYTDTPSTRGFERLYGDLLGSDLPSLADASGYPFVRFIGESLAIVGVDSTRVRGWSHYVVGRLGQQQLGALELVLDHPDVRRRTTLLLSHHGPRGPEGAFDWRESGLLDAGRLQRLLHERAVILHHGHSHHRYWHKAHQGQPHSFGAGSSTETGREGFWVLDVEDHLAVSASSVTLEPRHSEAPTEGLAPSVPTTP